MSREFNPPPVVFPSPSSGAGAGTTTSYRFPTVGSPPPPPFQPSHPSNPSPNIPFVSFDIGSDAPPPSSFSSPPLVSGIPISSFDEESPLLEELGINTRQIWRKTISILNPLRINSSLHEDADLGGPFVFIVVFGLFQLFAGKLHFGVLLGWVTAAGGFLYVVFNMLAGRNGSLDFYRCVSLVGYSLLPMVIFSALTLFVPRAGPLIFGMGAVFILWSTRVCTGLMVESATSGDEHRWLVAYACLLVYMLFALLVIF